MDIILRKIRSWLGAIIYVMASSAPSGPAAPAALVGPVSTAHGGHNCMTCYQGLDCPERNALQRVTLRCSSSGCRSPAIVRSDGVYVINLCKDCCRKNQQQKSCIVARCVNEANPRDGHHADGTQKKGYQIRCPVHMAKCAECKYADVHVSIVEAGGVKTQSLYCGTGCLGQALRRY